MHRSMTTRSRTALALATGVALALTLSACAQGSATNTKPAAKGGRATVRFMDFSANGGHEKDLAAIVNAFQDKNPGITVQIETVPFADYFTKLQTAVAGGTVADTFELNYENFVTYASNGSLAEVRGADSAAYKKSLFSAFTLNKKQFGLPESFSNVVLFYNKGLFDAAGVPAPTADWTWQDEKAAAGKLTNRGAGVFGDYQPVTYNEFYKALAQSGALRDEQG